MIAQFALRLIVGISLMWAVMPRKEVTCGFFRIQMMLVLGLAVLAALTLGRYAIPVPGAETLLSTTTMRILCGTIALVAYLGSVVWTLARRPSGNVAIFAILILSTVTLVSTVSSVESLQTSLGWLTLLSELSTAGILGAAMTGMLLGHWYLTAPTMSIAPLSSMNNWLGVTVVVRFLLSAAALLIYFDQISGSTHFTWFLLRWVAGILGMIAVFLMTRKILTYRNTQSATGVLFVGVILTFLGELSALLLYRGLHLPL